MGFIAVNGSSGQEVELQTASSTTIAKGDALAFASGYVQRATSSTAEVLYVADEDKVTAGGAHETIRCIRTKNVLFQGDTANNTAVTLLGTKIDLTDHDTLNDAASSTDVFLVEKIVGAVADKKVQGFFVQKIA